MVVAHLPGGETGEEVGGQVQAVLAQDVGVGDNAVGCEDFVGHVAELGTHGFLIILEGGSLSAENLHGRAFQGVPAGQQRYLGLDALLEDIVGALYHEVAVQYHVGHSARRQELLQLFGAHGAGIGHAGDSYALQELGTGGFGIGQRRSGVRENLGARGKHGAGNVALGQRGAHQERHGEGAGRLTHDVDAVRVSAESCDVVLDPLDGGHLIQETVVATACIGRFGREVRVGEEAEDTFAVVGGDADNAFLGDGGTVVAGLTAGAGHQAAAVEVDEHRQAVGCGFGRGPYIEVQAVFAAAGAAEVHVAEYIGLHGVVAELLGGAYACPFLNGLGSLPAEFSHGCLGEGNAQELLHAVFCETFHRTGLGFHLQGDFLGGSAGG